MNNPIDSGNVAPAWLTQLADPNLWQSWYKALPGMTPQAGKDECMDGFDIKIDAAAMAQLQNDYVRRFSALIENISAAKMPTVADKRFAAPAWHANPLHEFNAAAYLLNARFLLDMTNALQAAPKIKQRVRFAVQQVIDAMSPANFLATNPEAQQKMLETEGGSLLKGVEHLLGDMRKGRISLTDETVFEVGKNVATTEGAVVFENALFQLIQYKPLTAQVYQRPLLIVPPCINKFYILDLQPHNSLVRYAVEQGHSVFLISWRNPDESMAQLTWDDYVDDAVIKAIHVTQEISKQDRINTLGFCVGGTLLSTALALLFARGEKPVASLTLLTAFLDFSDTGIIDVFVDEMQVAMRESAIGTGGLMTGREFTSTFSSLRPNDLIWNYVGSNYLKGEEPGAFDLLYWNADSTNLPGPMFCWYLRNTYLENNLKVPGRTAVAGEKVDLRKIDAPAFIYGSREDHIVPWASAYASTTLLNPKKPGRNRFVLGASGHIAGVINPPHKQRRSYWTCDQSVPDAQAWMAAAVEHAGSWWPEWADFLAGYGGKKVAAPRRFGNAKYKTIEPAPGRYVKVKAE